MTGVFKDVIDASGAPQPGKWVEFAAYPPGSTIGGAAVLPVRVQAVDDGNGHLGRAQADLEPSSAFDVVGVVYQVTTPHSPSPADNEIQYIEVPGTGGPYNVEDILTDPPGALPEAALAAFETQVHAARPWLVAAAPDAFPSGQVLDPATAGDLATETAARTAGDSSNATAIATETSRATAAEALRQLVSAKDQPNGYAGLGGNGKIPTSEIPAIGLVNVFTVASQAAMLALTAQAGDVAVRTDLNESFMLGGTGDPTVLGDWIQLASPGQVTSVNGQQGIIVLGPSDVGADAAGAAAAAQAAATAYTDLETVRAQAAESSLSTELATLAAIGESIAFLGGISNDPSIDNTTFAQQAIANAVLAGHKTVRVDGVYHCRGLVDGHGIDGIRFTGFGPGRDATSNCALRLWDGVTSLPVDSQGREAFIDISSSHDAAFIDVAVIGPGTALAHNATFAGALIDAGNTEFAFLGRAKISFPYADAMVRAIHFDAGGSGTVTGAVWNAGAKTATVAYTGSPGAPSYFVGQRIQVTGIVSSGGAGGSYDDQPNQSATVVAASAGSVTYTIPDTSSSGGDKGTQANPGTYVSGGQIVGGIGALEFMAENVLVVGNDTNAYAVDCGRNYQANTGHLRNFTNFQCRGVHNPGKNWTSITDSQEWGFQPIRAIFFGDPDWFIEGLLCIGDWWGDVGGVGDVAAVVGNGGPFVFIGGRAQLVSGARLMVANGPITSFTSIGLSITSGASSASSILHTAGFQVKWAEIVGWSLDTGSTLDQVITGGAPDAYRYVDVNATKDGPGDFRIKGVEHHLGELDLAGAIDFVVRTVSAADATLTAADFWLFVNTGAAARAVNLPAANAARGRTYVVSKNDSGAGAVNIVPHGSDTVDISSIDTAFGALVLVADGASNWQAIPFGAFPYTDPPTTSAVGDAPAQGADPRYAKGDHRHGREGFGVPVAVAAANAVGSLASVPRADHVHRGADPNSVNTFLAEQIFARAIDLAVRTITADRTLDGTDCVVRANAAGGAINITLPAASDGKRLYIVKKTDASANAVTFATTGADTTDATSISFQNGTRVLISDGVSSWMALVPQPFTSAPTTSAVADAPSQGASALFSRGDHRHGREGFAAPGSSAVGDAAAPGSATTLPRSDHQHGREGFGAPSASAVGDASSNGAAATVSRSDHRHAREAFGSPSTQALGDAAADGVATTDARSDHKHAMPDSTAGPDADVTVDAAGAAGTLHSAARSGHGHKVATSAAAPAAIGTAAAGSSGTAPSRGDHVHATGAAAPTASAVGDAAATGSGPAAAMTDHKHGRESFGAVTAVGATDASANGSATTPSRSDHNHGFPSHGAAQHTDRTRSLWIPAQTLPQADGTAAATNVGVAPDIISTRQLADAATNGLIFPPIAIPKDAVAAQPLSIRIVWLPASTDATPHTVRWSVDALDVVAATDPSSAGTTTNHTGDSAARTIRQAVIESAFQILASVSADDLIRLDVRRVGADAADTYVGAVNVVGVFLDYTADS